MDKLKVLLLTFSFMLLSISSCFAWGLGWGWGVLDDIGDRPLIQYYAHTLEKGWSDRANDGEAAGDPYGSQTIDAIRVQFLTGRNMYVMYRVHVQNGEWTGWAMNGSTAGIYGKPIDGIQIALGSWRGDLWSVSYKGRIKNQGWSREWLPEGEILGNLQDPILSFRVRVQ